MQPLSQLGASAVIVVANQNTAGLALAVRLSVDDEQPPAAAPGGALDTEQALYLFSLNYFALLPGESRTVTANATRRDGSSTDGVKLRVDGWNVAESLCSCD